MDVNDKAELDYYLKAGSIAQQALQRGAKLIKIGVSMKSVLDNVEAFIETQGAAPAFPAQISVNHIAAHYCPTDEEDYIFKEGDTAKLDIGVHKEGRIADTAMTVDLGNNPELVKASKEACENALKIAKPGTTLGNIGKTIQQTIESHGFKPIRNLSGHGLGHYQIHEKPNIPNVDTKDKTELKEGQVIAIEPFATNGAGEIYESTNATVYTLIDNKPTRSPMTRSVMTQLKTYQGLPFTTRWLTRKHGLGKTQFALRELMATGNLYAHPPLPDKNKGIVSQHEHSVIVSDKPIVYTNGR